MKHIREVTSRFRLIWSLAALVVLLGALSVSPVRADPSGCEAQCWTWNAFEGCTVGAVCHTVICTIVIVVPSTWFHTSSGLDFKVENIHVFHKMLPR